MVPANSCKSRVVISTGQHNVFVHGAPQGDFRCVAAIGHCTSGSRSGVLNAGTSSGTARIRGAHTRAWRERCRGRYILVRAVALQKFLMAQTERGNTSGYANTGGPNQQHEALCGGDDNQAANSTKSTATGIGEKAARRGAEGRSCKDGRIPALAILSRD